MRRIASPAGSEQGAVAVIVALMMVVLLGFAAISIDVAKLYSERAQLQNGADAAALLVAQKCANSATVPPSSSTDPDCSATSPGAATVVNGNAVDKLSNVKYIALDQPGRVVQVTTGAKESGGDTNSVSLFFAGVLGFPSAEVSAQASASWGSPTAGRGGFPLAVSICQVKDDVGGALQLLQNHGNNANDDCTGPSGTPVPGGFGWLTSDPGACGATVDITAPEVSSNPGADAPAQCAAELQRWIDDINAGKEVVVYLPVYDKVTASGRNAEYRLVSFAAFQVTGWKFSGASSGPDNVYTFQNRASAATGVTAATECRNNCRGIIGKFVRYVSLADGYTMGPVDPNGARIVRLVP